MRKTKQNTKNSFFNLLFITCVLTKTRKLPNTEAQDIIFLNNVLCVCLGASMCHVYRCQQRPEKDTGSLGAGVTKVAANYLYMHAGN